MAIIDRAAGPVALSPARRAFVQRLFTEYQRRETEDVARRQEQDRQRDVAAPQIRAVADRIANRELTPDDIRQACENLARQLPYFGFVGPNGQMFLNQLV